MNWYIGVLKQYAVFSGRSRRQEFWMFMLFHIIISFVLSFVESMVGGPGVLGLIYALGVLLPSLGVSIRRLHDTGRSGWWILIVLVPIVGGIVLLVYYCQDSAAGENQFGASPKEGAAPAAPAAPASDDAGSTEG
jgi:uncharacterized membrane protein YhaH (DUF805 family)